MITRKDLERLAALKSDEGIVSAYIKVDPKLAYDRQSNAAQFKGAVRTYLRGKSGGRQAALDRESGRILKFLEDRPPQGRGIAVFACAPAGVWETLTLRVTVPSFVDVGPKPAIEVLARILDEYPRLAVAVVQRDQAHIYLSDQREKQEQAAVASEVPGRHDQGGWAQARFQRHIEVHVQRHLKEVVDEIEKLYYDRPYSQLAVGGSPEAVDEFVKMLPDPVARRVVGTFPVDLKHDTEMDVLERARALGGDAERRQERGLVRQAVDAAGAGGRGVAGVENTLRAVVEGRVHVLLAAGDLALEGAACESCGYLAAAAFDRCPDCGGAGQPVVNVVERAIERAFLAGAQIETVLGDARDTLLQHGGLAAVLRY